MSKRFLSLLLALVMVFSLVTPLIPVLAAETDAEAISEQKETDLRFGVLSDIHVSYDYVDEVYGNVSGFFNGVQPGRFEKALRFFKAQGVEAVVVAGDLQEASGTDEASLDKQKDWLQTVVDIWFKVFPEEKGEEGYVEPIFTYGNHDTALIAAQYWPEEWGTYEDAFIKEVNGYSFVCTHNGKENLAVPLLEKVAPDNQDKPIFYVQHCPVNNTVPGSTSGYGVGYGQTGRANAADYPNLVGFNGHTHAPLTDEKSIWQGDAGNEGQFTIINTATINYTGLNNDDMSVNSYAGNAQQTEHGMIVDVTGSEVAVDRYSFNDMTIDTESGTVSGEAVKLGQTWAWDACDITDRPYAYDKRYETANAPVFAEGAEITVDAVTDTSVKVTVPAASLTAPAGYRDMIESYIVEACNPTSGEVEASGQIATSYHVDDKADVYEASYTVTVTGLKPGTTYTLKAYAQEFFKKRSEPLCVEITTTGELTEYRVGDVNKDGVIDQTDMEKLTAVLTSDTLIYNAAADIDGNGVLENRDIAELRAILDASRVTYPESEDLMDLVHQVKLSSVSTSANYQPVDYGTVIQNSVVRGDSNQAVKTWTTNYAYYPVTTMYFSEPVDLSGYTHLSFDTLFENEYNLSDSYRKRWLSVSLISGNQEQVASYGSMNFDSGENGWETKVLSLANLKNIDLTAVTGIRFSHNFDYYEGRFDGVTEHAIYWDNFRGFVIEGDDSDLLSGATVTGGQIVFGAGSTNHTNQAILSTGGTVDYAFPTEKVITDYAAVKLDIRTPVSSAVQVQPFDANGNLLGTAVTVDACPIYQSVSVSVAAMGLEEGTVVAGLRFTYTCDHLLLDNMFLQGSKDYDLIGTASSFNALGGASCTAMITTEGGNGSNNALYAYAAPGTSVWGGGGELIYDTPLDLSETPYLRFDMKVENAHWAFGVCLYNSEGDLIWKTVHYNGTSSGGQYATYEFDLRTYRTHDAETGYTYHEVTAEQLKDVAKITLTCDLASKPNWMTSDDTANREVWFDNLVACNPLEDFFGADTSLVGPSAVQDGFICEILPETDDGHTNILHWYSDPENNGGTTSNSPGETLVTIQKNVKYMNHSGYDSADYDYVEFNVKNTGTYCAFYLSFLDASGATLGKTGEYRISLGMEWTTFRIDLNSLGMSAEDIANIETVSMSWNWQYQNINSTEVKKIADIYIDNMGFGCVPENSKDLFDQVTKSSAFGRWWYSANNTYPGAGWLFQSDVTVNSDTAFMFYRSPETIDMGYETREHLHYFQTPVTVEEDWLLTMDVINNNFRVGSKISVIGSDGKYYSCFTMNQTGDYSVQTVVNQLVTTDGIAFDPATTTITGLIYYTNFNPHSNVDTSTGGYIVYDNLSIVIPEPMDKDDLLYGAGCSIGENQTAFTNNSLSAWKLNPVTGWSYPSFALKNTVDISKHKLEMDIYPAGMKHFRIHLSGIDASDVGSDYSALYYDVDKWTTVSYDLTANSAGLTEMSSLSIGIECTVEDGVSDYALYIDNVRLVEKDPDPIIYNLDGLDLIANANTVELNNTDVFESAFVFEVLDEVDGRNHVVHMYSDPENGGGLSVNSSYYYGPTITLSSNDIYVADGIDFVELNLKNTNIYCDQLYIAVLNAQGTTLGSVYKRMAMTSDWATYRLDLATLGLTEEELATIASVQIRVNWSKQYVGASAPVAGEVYIDNVTFGCYVDESNDMFDHIASVQNVEWWWSGNNTYGGAGWLLEENANGNTSFKIYRKTQVDSGAGYTPRRQFLYFDEPITLSADTIVSIDAVNTYMGTGTKISLLGDDGKKYGYLKLDQTGSKTYKMAINEFVLLNADTHMTVTETPIDVESVKVIGVIMHNDFFNGDKTYEGNLVMDNFVFGVAPNPLDDAIANYSSLTKPTHVESGFACEILDETADGRTNVIHWYADPNSGAGTTSNWPGTTKLYIGKVPHYVDATQYDYVEFSYKHYGVKYWFSLTVYDVDGNIIGASTGKAHSGYTEWRTSNESGWATHRIDLDTMGLTAEELLTVGCFEISVSWEYNNVSGTTKQVGEMWIDDLRFGCVDKSSEDMIDRIVETDIYSDNGATAKFIESDWYWNEDGAFVITRGSNSTGWKGMRLYFDEAISVESDWILSCDFDITNFHHGGSISLLGSDGNVYSNSVAPNKAGQNTVTKENSGFATSSGTAFESATVQIVGIHISYSLGTSSAVTDTTTGGYMSLDNLIFTDPSAE